VVLGTGLVLEVVAVVAGAVEMGVLVVMVGVAVVGPLVWGPSPASDTKTHPSDFQAFAAHWPGTTFSVLGGGVLRVGKTKHGIRISSTSSVGYVQRSLCKRRAPKRSNQSTKAEG
jgi:hypothetical protein